MLGGNHDNAVGTSRTVDSGSGGILQDFDALDVGGVHEVGIVAYLHSIYNIKRRSIAIDGADTTDADCSLSVRRTVLHRNLHTGGSTLKGLTDVLRHALHYGSLVNGSHRTRDVALLHRTVTYNHYVFKGSAVLFEGDLHAVLGSYLLRKIADERHMQLGACRNTNGEITIEIGDGAIGRSYLNDVSSSHGFPKVIQHLSPNGHILGNDHHWEHHEQYECIQYVACSIPEQRLTGDFHTNWFWCKCKISNMCINALFTN